MPAQLTVFVPNLFSELVAAGSALDPRRCPAIVAVLGRATARRRRPASVEQSLLQLLGFAADPGGEWQIAGLTAALECPELAAQGLWRADPVHLRADPTRILLFDDRSLGIDPIEADTLIALLNESLGDLRFKRGACPSRWYVSLDPSIAAATRSPRSLNAESIEIALPSAGGDPSLNRLMNEIQMVLHAAPGNAVREAGQRPPINGLWLWGGGGVVPMPPPAPVVSMVVGDDVTAGALAKRANVPWRPITDGAQFAAGIRRSDGHVLVVLGSPTGSFAAAAPSEILDSVERAWLAPLLKALRSWRLGRLNVITRQFEYSLTPWRYYWRLACDPQHALAAEGV